MRLRITGFGIVSSLGVGREAWEKAIKAGGLRERAFGRDSTIEPGAKVAEVWDWDPNEHLGAKGHRSLDQLTKFLITAARGALVDAGIKRDGEFVDGAPGPERIGVASATAYGSLDAITELNRVAELEDPRYINPQRFPNTVINAAAGYVSIWEDLRAPNTTVVDGNCGALDAVLVADTHLSHHRADAMVVGGGEVATEPLLKALSKLGLFHDETPLEVGEGAVFFVMERGDSAREAPCLAEVIGYGTAFDAPASEALLVHGSAVALAAAVRGALADAGLEPSDIDFVISGECGVRLFDEAESVGLAECGIVAPRHSPKTFLGETFGVSGAFGMAVALSAFEGGATEIFSSPAFSPRHILVVALGYYGNASAVILRKSKP